MNISKHVRSARGEKEERSKLLLVVELCSICAELRDEIQTERDKKGRGGEDCTHLNRYRFSSQRQRKRMEEKKKRSQEMEEEKSLDTTNVFVKFLPSSIDDIHLHHLFSPYGRIVSAKVMVDPRTWRSLGYGYVSKRGEERRRE